VRDTSANIKAKEFVHSVPNRVYRDLLGIRIAIFCTLNVVSGEWYGGKILEKILVVPLTNLQCVTKNKKSSVL